MQGQHRTDRERWNLRGPVRACTLRRTWSSCGADRQCGSDTRSDTSFVEFRRDGAFARHRHENPDGSAWESTHEYDESGRLVAVHFSGPEGPTSTSTYEYDSEGRLERMITRRPDGSQRLAESYEYSADGSKQKTEYLDMPETAGCGGVFWTIEGSDAAYSADGASAVVLQFNHREQPIEATFTASDGRALSRVSLSYDERGLLAEEVQTVVEVVLPEEARAQLPPSELERFQALFGGGRVQVHRMHRYDAKGRRIETRCVVLGGLSEDRQIWEYNERGDQSLEILETDQGGGSLSEDGQFVDGPASRQSHRSEARFLYDYDGHGNWVKKVVEGRSDPNGDFSVSTIETRAIDYHPDPIIGP